MNRMNTNKKTKAEENSSAILLSPAGALASQDCARELCSAGGGFLLKGGKMSKSTYRYIRGSGIRQLAKECGKRCSSDFLGALDRYLYFKISSCCKLKNSGKTLTGVEIEMTK